MKYDMTKVMIDHAIMGTRPWHVDRELQNIQDACLVPSSNVEPIIMDVLVILSPTQPAGAAMPANYVISIAKSICRVKTYNHSVWK